MSEDAANLERLLRRDRIVTIIGLVILATLAWVYLLTGGGMGADLQEITRASLFPHVRSAMPMDGGGMSMGAPVWDASMWVLVIAMWWTMMLAMMTPSAAPAILLYARVHRHAGGERSDRSLAPTWAFAAGYLIVWLAFSLAAALSHFALEVSGAGSAMSGSHSRWFSAAILAAAGAYQLSPWHGVCLRHCRSPANFLTKHWRPGIRGAVRLGVFHGAYCVGCCWLLMGLLFVGGVMNLVWIAALSVLVLAEKLLPAGRLAARLSGLALLVWAGATLLV